MDHAFPDSRLIGIKYPGIDTCPPQVGSNKRSHEHVPVGQQEDLPVKAGCDPGQHRIQIRFRCSPAAGCMVAEGPERCLDPGLIPHVGIVFVNLNDQVGFPAEVHQLLEVFRDK